MAPKSTEHTPSPDEVRAYLETLDVDAIARRQRADGTIAFVTPAPRDASLDPTMASQETRAEAGDDAYITDGSSLPDLVIDPEGSPGAELTLGAVIGEGGMGVVRSAQQLALRRDVAVKTVRPGQASAVSALLREARVTGALDHPSIIPVYDLGRDADGQPVFVMKRIEGRSWEAAVAEPKPAPSDGEPELHKLVRRHVEILMRVCEAVHFAHSRGVIHRDIKPANVMLGSFGEVYLLDWGIAAVVDGVRRDELGIDDGHTSQLVGTPAYMAPEMVDPGFAPLSPATDVYLLGATLFEAVAGKPPQRGRGVVEVLSASLRGDLAPLPEWVPEDLARIVRKALARRPEDRYPSAEALRLALQAHLDRKAALDLLEESQHQLARLRVIVRGDGDGGRAGRGDADGDGRAHTSNDSIEVARIAGAIRFGLEQSREALSGFVEVDEAWRELAVLMVEWELACARPDVAQGWLAEVADDTELAERVEAALREAAMASQEIARLRELEQDLDTRTGSKGRVVSALWMASAWAGIMVTFGYLARNDIFVAEHGTLLACLVVQLALGFSVVALRRSAFLGNAFSRSVTYSMLAMFTAELGFWPVAWALDVPMASSLALLQVAFGMSTAAIAMWIDIRIGVSALAFLACGALTIAAPAYAYELMAVSNVIGLGYGASLFLPGRARAPGEATSCG